MALDVQENAQTPKEHTLKKLPPNWEGRGGALQRFPHPFERGPSPQPQSWTHWGRRLTFERFLLKELKGSEGCLVIIRVGVHVQSGRSRVETENRVVLEPSREISPQHL